MTSQDISQLLVRAGIAIDIGNIPEATHILEEAVARAPTLATVWSWLGDTYAQSEQYAAAEDAFRRAIELDKDLAGAHSGLGRVLQELNRHDQAVREFMISIQQKATASRYVLLAQSESALGLTSRAEGSLRQALYLEPENDEALLALALVVRQDRPNEAVALLRQAAMIAPKDLTIMRELGYSLTECGDLDEAIDLLTVVVEKDPDDSWAQIYRGVALERIGKLDLAESVFREAATRTPLFSATLPLLGSFLIRRGKMFEAEVAFRHALEIDPLDAESAAILGGLLSDRGEIAEAIRWIDTALRIDPDHKNARRRREQLAKDLP